MFGVKTPLQGTITEKDNRESKGGADALLFKRVHMGVFAAGVDRVLRSCLKNTGMRPPGYVVRTSLENQTQRLTRGQIGRTNTVAPCEAAVIHLLSPNACSTLPLSMMHRDEHNVNRHLKLFSCDKDQRKKHGS